MKPIARHVYLSQRENRLYFIRVQLTLSESTRVLPHITLLFITEGHQKSLVCKVDTLTLNFIHVYQ